MLFNYAEKTTPFTLSPESLDWHLARGWYRMGSNIFTTHFLFFQNRPYSAVWIRLDLEGFSFSRRQRKLMRRQQELFTYRVGPRTITPEAEALYRRYANEFDGRLMPTIADSLEDYDGEVVFNTWETSVREKMSGKLVARSYFDLGVVSAASILGIYEPDLKTHSLGYYTMLLEVEYCLEQGIRYYYPGYVVPGYQRFDYKLRIGDSEYYNLQQDAWLPYQSLEVEQDGPVEMQQRKLNAFVEAFSEVGYSVRMFTYPLFEAGLYDIWNDDYFPYPYCVPIYSKQKGDILIVAFDPRERHYFVLLCQHMAQTQLLFNSSYLSSFAGEDYLTELIAARKVIARSAHLQTIVDVCLQLIQHER